MASDRYGARIAGSVAIAWDVPYDALLKNVVRFTVEAAAARSADEPRWEHEELRQRGLDALEITRNGKALWCDEEDFRLELEEARREGAGSEFETRNELDEAFCEHLDRDLIRLWQKAGYATPSLLHCMRRLFVELQDDIADSTVGARKAFVEEIVCAVG